MLFTFIDIHASSHVDTADDRRFMFPLKAHVLIVIIVLYSVELGSVLFLFVCLFVCLFLNQWQFIHKGPQSFEKF